MDRETHNTISPAACRSAILVPLDVTGQLVERVRLLAPLFLRQSSVRWGKAQGSERIDRIVGEQAAVMKAAGVPAGDQ